jgi:hypothetical protein
MALFYLKHRVKDFDAWLPFFEGDQDRIHSVGAKTISVMRSIDDPNDLHMIFDVPNVPAFFKILYSPEVADIMKNAGVSEIPVLYKLEMQSRPA